MTGGGTLGPVTPLIAVAIEWQRQENEVTVEWIGTPGGPERELVERAGFHFQSLSVPKLSRDKWWTWGLIMPLLAQSSYKAYQILKEMQPDIVFTAGGFTSVPVVWMAKVLGIPTWVHQLDVLPGLANRLMAPMATRVSVTWEESAEAFGADKTLVVGGVVRSEIHQGSREVFLKKYKLDPQRKTVLVFGGGTGAADMNATMEVIGPDLASKMNVVHLTGKGKMIDSLQSIGPNYLALDFLDEDMKHALAAADVLVARAGMGTILEVLALQKATVLIPLPGSQQLHNTRIAQERDFASVIEHLTPQVLKQEILKLALDRTVADRLKRNARKTLTMEADRKIVSKAMELV